MQNGKIVVYVMLFVFCFIGDVFAGTVFIKPVDGWTMSQGDYSQFTEDDGHPCTENGDHSKCYSNGPFPAERHCGYGDQCSNRSGHSMHAAFDYDKPNHSGHGNPGEQYGGGAYHGSADDVKATNDGVIANVTFDGDNDYGFGNTVVIKHTNLDGCTSAVCPGNKIYSQVSHMSNSCGDRQFGKGVRKDTGEWFDVEQGVHVNQGDIIGCIGGTGSGNENKWIDHLHFEFKTWSSVYNSGSSRCGATYGYPPVDDNRADIGTIKAELFECGYRDPADFLGVVSVSDSSYHIRTADVCEVETSGWISNWFLQILTKFKNLIIPTTCAAPANEKVHLTIDTNSQTATLSANDSIFTNGNDEVSVTFQEAGVTVNEVENGGADSLGGAWRSGGPYPDDPIYDNDPFVPNADVSIRYLRIKGPGQSNHHTESGAVFFPGQTQSVDLKGKIKNESNDNTDMARIQYCATTKKKFRHDERIWIDEDYLDHQEREHDFDPGESITKHGQASITLATDLSSITVFKGNRSHTFPITEKHLYEKKIPVYFWIDTKVEVGNDEDYDVSCSVGSHCGDEYAKFEVLLPWFNSSFNLSAVGGEAPLQVNFTNTSQAGNGATISSSWDFGDGETSDEENPVHIYNQAGTYTVSLTTVSNWGEVRTSRATVVVTDSPINGIVDTNYGSTDPGNPKVLTEELTEGRCFSGTPTTLLGMGVEGNPWEWTCQGENGGIDETGYAALEEVDINPGPLPPSNFQL